MPTRRATESSMLVTAVNQPLIGVILADDHGDTAVFFGDEATADATLAEHATERALAAIGAWSHLDWDEVEQALDRIRHESRPTPPIEDL